MIYGIGQDIIENKRIADLLSRYGNRFINKILSPDEITQATAKNNKVLYIAKRFAAKEAFSKACGTGFRTPILLPFISITNDSNGKPILQFTQPLQNWLNQKGIKHAHVSLSDEQSFSMALVILET